MAALFSNTKSRIIQNILCKTTPGFMVKRGSAIPPKQKPRRGTIKHRNLIKSSEESLASRGFLRSQKPYTPPENVEDKIKSLISNYLKSTDLQAPLSVCDKFNLLSACFQEFKHSVPNSMLYRVETPVDVVNFYKTPVSTTTPLDEFKDKDLPPNLHIQYDYVRFHPDTDTFFGGVTAFPESSTIVTGLRYKDKYKGHKQRLPYYYDNWSDFIRHDEYKP